MTTINKIIIPVLCISLGCGSALQNNVDKFASAATAICDGMTMVEKYKSQLENIKSLIEKKDYMTALYYAKGLYVEVQQNGDLEQIPEVVSLVSVLSNLASKVPLKAFKETGVTVL